MIRKFRLGLCILVVFLLQTSLVHRFSWRFVGFDLLGMLAAYLALNAPVRGALWSVLLLGLLRDLASAGRLGGGALLYVAAAGGLILARGRVRRNAATDILLVFLFLLFCGALRGAFVAVLTPGPQAGPLLWRALGVAGCTAAVSFAFRRAFRWGGIVSIRETGAS